MKKYTMPSMAIVEIGNEAILAGSFGAANNQEGYSPDGYQGGFGRGRRGHHNNIEDLDDEFEDDFEGEE